MSLSIEKLLATCKRENPAKLLAYLGNDEQRQVSVKGGRKRWANTIATVEQLQGWTRVELLDKQGALLATVENTDPAGELEDLRPGRNRTWDQVERGLQIVLKAQDAYAKSREAEMRAVMAAQTEMTREVTASVKVLAQLHREQLEAVKQSEEVRLEAAMAASQNSGDWAQLIEALPTLLQLVPVARTLLSGGQGPPPVNGVNKGGKS